MADPDVHDTVRAIVLDFNGTLAQDDHLVGPCMRVVAIRGLGYDPASGYADIVIDRLDPAALDLMLAIGSTAQRQ